MHTSAKLFLICAPFSCLAFSFGCGAISGRPSETVVNPCGTGQDAIVSSTIDAQCAGKVDGSVLTQSGSVSGECKTVAGITYTCITRQTYNDMCAPNGLKSVDDIQRKSDDKVYFFKKVECQTPALVTCPPCWRQEGGKCIEPAACGP